ncbi:hypothetical protein TPHA_0C04340 [Tetrapisispora phaffii CBS 4417]|uniref:Protoporphyrinogen oxidase n=1 Tax=Tetrapisispora phaffii (strain ATCC 24235 / CBS 4417 / NBRC 1672 / NRRL Y-8282 / UCD 70-5) TaxID=1071381 RepID=G8BQS2_TETPH|nr:hypothetical protein TPHA_0C04340 [Tetrapisispora phaffii CBS 4417]CCE62584.1 hypothetical protein TPHA_0C04340 [Tetrapisispora phaffii CBS 4417]
MALANFTKLKSNSSIAVVGSGVSGLTFTYFLNKLRPDLKITILDEQKKNGGWLYSYKFQDSNDNNKDVMLEKGPRTLRGKSLGTAIIIDIIKKLEQFEKVQTISPLSDANKKFLLDVNNNLVKVPNKILSFDSINLLFFNSLGKNIFTSIIGEPFRSKKILSKNDDETVSSFLNRRFGKSNSVSNNLMSAIYHGIYADDLNRMSLKKQIQHCSMLERTYGSIIKSLFSSDSSSNAVQEQTELTRYDQHFNNKNSEIFKLNKQLEKFPMLGITGGLQSFPNMISNYLVNKCLPNVKIIREARVDNIEDSKDKVILNFDDEKNKPMEFDHVRVTSNPMKLKSFFKGSKEIEEKLRNYNSVTTLLVNYYLPNKDVIKSRYHSFGYLVPQANENKNSLLGVIFDSVIEKNFQSLEKGKNIVPNEYTKLTLMMGGHYLEKKNYTETQINDSQYWISNAKDCLSKHLGIDKQDLDNGHFEFTVAKNGIPQYFVGYMEWANDFEKLISDTYNNKVSLGGMGFSRGPGVPDVVVDSLDNAIKLSGK